MEIRPLEKKYPSMLSHGSQSVFPGPLATAGPTDWALVRNAESQIPLSTYSLGPWGGIQAVVF
jgi:hypothetical protein